jgi:hypothetical protein
MSTDITTFQSVESTQLGNTLTQGGDLPPALTNVFDDLLAAAGLADTSKTVAPTLPVDETLKSPGGGYTNDFDKTIEQIGAELKQAGVSYDPGKDI